MTEQELLTALRHCMKGTCKGCPLDKEPGECSVCAVGLLGYASDAIESMMEELGITRHQLEQAKQERDAAVESLNIIIPISHHCGLCLYNGGAEQCKIVDGCCGGIWSGLCAENGGTDATD